MLQSANVGRPIGHFGAFRQGSDLDEKVAEAVKGLDVFHADPGVCVSGAGTGRQPAVWEPKQSLQIGAGRYFSKQHSSRTSVDSTCS